MRRYNIISRTLLILTVITLALASPVLVQGKRQARGDEVHVPGDMTTVLGKRALEEEMNMLWKYYNHVWRNRIPIRLQEPAPPSNLRPPNRAAAEIHVPEVNVPPPNLAQAHVPEVHVPPQSQGPADSGRESMELGGDALPTPGSSKSGHSLSPPPTANPESSTSNVPSAESQSENLKTADSELEGKAKVSRRVSGNPSSGVDRDTGNAVGQMELRSASAVDPGP